MCSEMCVVGVCACGGLYVMGVCVLVGHVCVCSGVCVCGGCVYLLVVCMW